MLTSARVVYVDSSALVKLVVDERESVALARFLESGPSPTSCALARVEVVRAVRSLGIDAITRARRTLRTVDMIRLDDELLDLAAEIGPHLLRTLDAIHLAAAWRLRPHIEMVTYDRRLGEASQAMGIPVMSPGR